ncbi:hypothetical protein MYX78_10425 [Acidobacteria bacterium AH-259-G07]|nr:hypothetical protein [Acidobacteria bacterium AH-259-G07]
MINKILFVIYILYCFEVGIFLVIFPWMRLWEQNLLLEYSPYLRFVFLNNFFRGAVSGLGLANLMLGVWEIAHFQQYFRKA